MTVWPYQALSAIHAAQRMWGGPIAQVIEDEIMAHYDHLRWLGDRGRTNLLIEQILDLEEKTR